MRRFNLHCTKVFFSVWLPRDRQLTVPPAFTHGDALKLSEKKEGEVRKVKGMGEEGTDG